MEFVEFRGKTVDDAITNALVSLGTTSDQIEYEVIEKGSNGILGFGSKDAVIKVARKLTPEDVVKDRFNRLLHEVQTISAEQCAIHEGTVQTVLVECVNEHDNHLMTGRMSNNLLVHFPGDESLIGQLVDVHLDECKGFYYMGRIESN